MDTSKILQKVLRELALRPREKTITSAPQRPRSLATEALNSEEIMHLAKHIIKITLWPNISYKKGWLKEIKASLDNLAFKLCRSSVRKDGKRFVQDLWYTPSEIVKKLDEVLDDAYWKVIKELQSKVSRIEFDPFGTGNLLTFTEFGYTIKEEKSDEYGITLTLWLGKEKIV